MRMGDGILKIRKSTQKKWRLKIRLCQEDRATESKPLKLKKKTHFSFYE